MRCPPPMLTPEATDAKKDSGSCASSSGQAGRTGKSKNHKARPAGLNLIRRFSLLSFASIALVSVVSSTFLSQFITDTMLKRDAAVTMEVIQSECDAEHAQEFFLNQHAPRLVKEASLVEFFERIGNLPEVLRVNVYGQDKTLLWSTEKRLVGQRFDRNEELDEALTGVVAVESGITGREENPKQEHKFLNDDPVPFVETYIPIRHPATQQVIGAIELYRIPRALFETIAAGRRRVWAFDILGGLFLYIALFGIVYRGARLINSQQERLVESETMSAMGEMASAVAHGIRNPLASIRSSAELALCEKDSTCNGCSRDIIAEVDRLERWIRDLLTYSQPEDGTLEKVSLPTVVHRSLESFRGEAARRDIHVEVHLPPSLPPVQADEALLEQVLNSVVANAVEAMPQSGCLHVRGNAEAWTRRVTLAITDTGVGIPPHQLDKIFTPLFTTKPRGMGVGLSLARRILRRFGGDITLQSREGHGTTVNVQLLAAR